MILFPAIDIRDGRCVRLVEGDFARETIFADNPAQMAVRWSAAGGEYLHVVDLDGAVQGTSQNLTAIKAILAAAKMPVQVGGGIRTLSNIAMLLELGVTRVILGSVATQKPQLVQEACAKFPGQVVVGIDARAGEVAVEGWGVSSGISATELAKRMVDVGVKTIIFTDISRDGQLGGVNVAATAELARLSGAKVIASGGVATLEDIRALQKYENEGIEGCIIGKALYTGAIDLKEALAVAKTAQ